MITVPISLAAGNWTCGPKGWGCSRTAQPPGSSEPSVREELWTVLGEELSQRSALAAGLLRMGWPQMGDHEDSEEFGKGMIQAKRYPGKERPWLGAGYEPITGKGASTAV